MSLLSFVFWRISSGKSRECMRRWPPSDAVLVTIFIIHKICVCVLLTNWIRHISLCLQTPQAVWTVASFYFTTTISCWITGTFRGHIKDRKYAHIYFGSTGLFILLKRCTILTIFSPYKTCCTWKIVNLRYLLPWVLSIKKATCRYLDPYSHCFCEVSLA